MKTSISALLVGVGLVLVVVAHGLLAWGGIEFGRKFGPWWMWTMVTGVMGFGLYHVLRRTHSKGSWHTRPAGGHADHSEDAERGPNGGLLVNLGHGFVEVAIADAPARFRLFFHDQHKQARSVPRNAIVRIETVRSDDARQLFEFQPTGQCLESTTDIPEPHEFKAVVRVSHGPHSHPPHEVRFSHQR
jgi:hypothetical protein